MYTKLIQALLIIMVGTILFKSLPGLSMSIKNAMPGRYHSSQYNLVFWIMILIGIFALLKNRNQGNRE